MLLNQLKAPSGSRKSKKRVGRGESSGWGKTSGRGHKGQKARSGAKISAGFQGGQMPLSRRLPKRGFHNIFGKEYAVINVADINRFKGQTEIDLAWLKSEKVVKKKFSLLKILGDGELDTAVTVKANCFSRSAARKIEKAGGKAISV